MHPPNKTKYVALTGMLFALAIVLSVVESAITPMLGLTPGVKIGLSNIVVMYALFFMGPKQAFSLAVLKSLFVVITRGVVAGALSFTGGIVSLLVMWLLYRLFKNHITYFILSVCGALSHNVGQLIAASFILGSKLALTYAPILIVSGLIMGWVTSFSLGLLLPALGRMGFHDKKI